MDFTVFVTYIQRCVGSLINDIGVLFFLVTDLRSETQWNCPWSNNATNQPLQTPALIHMSQTHKHWYQSCWSLSAAIHLTGCVWCSIFSTTRLLFPCSVACMRLCMFAYISKLCICMPYPTLCPVPVQVLSSWWPPGLCRISWGPSSKLSSGLFTVNPDTSSRMSSTETKTKGRAHQRANVHIRCVYQEISLKLSYSVWSPACVLKKLPVSKHPYSLEHPYEP